MNDMMKNILLWLVIAAVLLTVFNNFNTPAETNRISYSEFVKEVQSGQIAKVTVDGYIISGNRTSGDSFDTVRPAASDPKIMDDLLTIMAQYKSDFGSGQCLSLDHFENVPELGFLGA